MAQRLMRVNRTWFPATGLVFPNALTTGVPAGTTLTTLTSATNAAAVGGLNSGWSWDGAKITLTANNAMIDALNVTSSNQSGTIVLSGFSNVTIQRCLITNTGGGTGSHGINILTAISGVTIQRCNINGGNATTQRLHDSIFDTTGLATNVLIAYNDFQWWRTAILFGSQGLITGNYLHDIGYISGDHTNGMLTPVAPTGSPGAVLTISGNTIWTNHSETDAIMLNPNSSSNNIGNTTVTGNLLAGGSNTFYGGNFGGNTTSYIVVTGNYFSTRYYANSGSSGTHAQYQTAGVGNVWSGNTWYDGPLAGQLIPA